jgi:hypothetical protein
VLTLLLNAPLICFNAPLICFNAPLVVLFIVAATCGWLARYIMRE